MALSCFPRLTSHSFKPNEGLVSAYLSKLSPHQPSSNAESQPHSCTALLQGLCPCYLLLTVRSTLSLVCSGSQILPDQQGQSSPLLTFTCLLVFPQSSFRDFPVSLRLHKRHPLGCFGPNLNFSLSLSSYISFCFFLCKIRLIHMRTLINVT